MKEFELRSLYGYPGSYTAVLYNCLHGYYTEQHFLYYTKKEIFYKLRHEYNCTVSRRFNYERR